MTRSSKQDFLLAVAALALGAAACSAGAGGDIPCVEDVTCPSEYPVCGPQGKCIAGTSTQKAEVAIVGPEGYMASEFVAGPVRMLVTARAKTGVASVKLASGTTNFPASSTPATPPLYAFDVDTMVLPDGDVPLAATVTAGDGSAGSASGTLHVDNATIPSISSFTFQGGGTAATFAPGADVVFAHVYNSAGGTATINGVAAAASGSTTTRPNIQSSSIYTLTVTGPAGLLVTRSVTATVSALITSFSAGPSLPASSGTATITSGGSTKLFASFAGRGTAPPAISCAPSCNGTLAATTIANGGSVNVTGTTTGTLTYTLTVSPTTGADATATAVVKVVPPANAVSLTASSSVIHQGGSTTLTPIFDFGSSPAVSGTATIVGSDGSVYGNLSSGAGVQVAPTVPNATYTLVVFNGAGTAASTAPAATVSVAQGFWTSLNTTTFAALRGASVTALDNGKVLIAGGVNLTDTPQNTAYLCDATGDCVAKPGAMASPRAYHAAVKVGATAPNNAGKVLLVGGYTAAGPATPTNSAELYDPQSDSFSATTAISGARSRHVAVLLADDRNVLIAGGTNGTANLGSAIKYDAGAAPPTATSLSAAMAQLRASFTGTLLANGKVLIVGGAAGNASTELFDAAGNTFGAGPALPAGEDKRGHTAVLIGGASSNNGKVLVSGGLTGAGVPSSTQFLYSSGTPGSFAAIASLATARSNQAAISLPTDSILICGGTSTGTDTLKSCERYDPASGSGSQLPTAAMLEARKDFGLAPILISSQIEILAAGSPSTPNNFGESYNPN